MKSQKMVRLLVRLLLHSIVLATFLYGPTLQSHGFAAGTLISLSNNKYCGIEHICNGSQLVAQRVISYEVNSHTATHQRVITGTTQHNTSYYILSFYDKPDHDIICSPIQLFYKTTNNHWITASHLKVGDALRTLTSSSIVITAIQYIQQPLKTHTLHIQNTHTFAVGAYGIVAHNSEISLAIGAGISAIFSGCGSGAAAGSFFGPAGVIGGIIIGGCVSILIKQCIQACKIKKPYTLCNDAINEDKTVPAKTVEEIIEESKPLDTKNTDRPQYEKKGTYEDALKDFSSLEPHEVKDIERNNTGKAGVLPDGRKVVVRIKSKDSRPTLEIQGINKN